MAASISSPQEEKEELAEAEKYTSKIANNYANEEVKKHQRHAIFAFFCCEVAEGAENQHG